MTRKKMKICNGVYVREELRYYATLGGLALMAPLSMAVMLWLLPATHAVDNWGVEGANGVLHVRGALTESACRLEMESANQEVWLGEVATGRLARPGDRGTPVVFQLRLRDCLRSPAANRDEWTGAVSWAPDQPAVQVSFIAPANPDNTQLINVMGAAGFGLRLEDSSGQDVRLGSHGMPILLQPGQDALNYRVVPERTNAALVAGSYQAIVGFHLSYD
ncbi:fimbrial protein [Serratia marcescens]|uniref:fimbrial protein n=1 Tax=Serratia marcescens TaxID=615 RepID=UPI0036F7A74E